MAEPDPAGDCGAPSPAPGERLPAAATAVLVPEGSSSPDAAPGEALPASSSRRGVQGLVPPALRVRTFRWYWAAQWPVLFGTWMQIVALGYFVLQVTHSQTAVGAVAAAEGLPAVGLPLLGGAIADRVPRRRVLVVTQSILGGSSAILAFLALSGHASVWAILATAVVYGSADAVDLPTRQALIADLVDRDLVMGAVALGSVAMSATRIVGPSLAGVLIATAGPAACFAVLAAAYVVPIVVLVTVVPDRPPPQRPPGSTAAGDVVAGLRLAIGDPLVRTVLLCASALSFFGVSYMPYLPVLARTQLHAGAQVLGLLYSVGGIGGLVGGVILATLRRSAARVWLLLVGGVVYGGSLFTVSHGRALPVVLPALVGVSFGFLAINTSLTTLLQTETEAAVRGRLLGIYTMVFAGFQPLGTLMYGLVGRYVSLFDAIGVGALLVAAVTVAAATRGPLRRLARPVPATIPG